MGRGRISSKETLTLEEPFAASVTHTPVQVHASRVIGPSLPGIESNGWGIGGERYGMGKPVAW